MMSAERQERLTRVGPGTPMGELLRRYWYPVAATGELGRGRARAVRLLGEDLVLFRTTEGELGLVDELCPHRRASLRYGAVDAQGIRCPYHGWKFDRGGRCVEMPAEGDDPAALRLGHTRAYHAQELGGLIFAYIGPAPAPLLPRYDVLVWDGALRDIGRAMLPCNWLQIMENSVDPTHVEWLHGNHLAHVRESQGKEPPKRYRRRHERIGFDVFRYGIIKRRVLEGGSTDDDDWAVGHPLIFPVSLRVGSHGQDRMQIRVPIDDTHTMHWWYACYRPVPGVEVPAQEEIPLYEVPWKDERGEYLVDFVDGQDIMAWVTQGPIADRTREVLVGSDRGITLLRKLYLEQIELVERGEDPMGVIRDAAENERIEMPQERNKYGDGAKFLDEAIELSHVRYSPLKEQIRALMGARPGAAAAAR
jgi:5,5'-dehydrodivanillate O-demethylase